VVAEIPGAVACALIDLTAGAVVGFTQEEALDPQAAIFLGDHARALFTSGVVGWVEEAHVVSRFGHHLTRTLKGGRFAATVLLLRAHDAAPAWSRLRAILPGLEGNL
jgi:hypothetical protein